MAQDCPDQTVVVGSLLKASFMMLASRARSLTFGARYARTVASPWGAEGWRHNKTDFAHWVKEASTQPNSKAKREFYGFLQLAFGDVDVDKDGKINAQEFDYLCEKVAAMPRRFGYAPSWEAEYGGSIEKRTAARKAMFDAVDRCRPVHRLGHHPHCRQDW